MKLVTKRLYFRPWTKKDIPIMIEMPHDNTIHQFIKVPYLYIKKLDVNLKEFCEKRHL